MVICLSLPTVCMAAQNTCTKEKRCTCNFGARLTINCTGQRIVSIKTLQLTAQEKTQVIDFHLMDTHLKCITARDLKPFKNLRTLVLEGNNNNNHNNNNDNNNTNCTCIRLLMGHRRNITSITSRPNCAFHKQSGSNLTGISTLRYQDFGVTPSKNSRTTDHETHHLAFVWVIGCPLALITITALIITCIKMAHRRKANIMHKLTTSLLADFDMKTAQFADTERLYH